MDASEKSASQIFVFHQGFLLFENVYFLILFYFFKKWGVGGGGYNGMCFFCLQVDEPITGRASKKKAAVYGRVFAFRAYHSTTNTSAFNFGCFFNSL